MNGPDTAPMQVNPDTTRGGLTLKVDTNASNAIQCSPTWTSGGRRLQFLFLIADAVLELPAGRNFIKVITGRLDNIDRTCFAAPFSVRGTEVKASKVTTGRDHALFALMTLPEEAPAAIENIGQLCFEGNQAAALPWQTFHEKYGAFLDAFDGQDCHMAAGFHLVDETGVEIAYVNPWACGKGVDLTTHNHAGDPGPLSPAFAEVHWVLAAGAPGGGMYEAEAPGSTQRTWHPMGLGQEHGPYFDVDHRGPVRLSNGAVKYPWHGWQSGDDGMPGHCYDYVWAFEINPDFVAA